MPSLPKPTVVPHDVDLCILGIGVAYPPELITPDDFEESALKIFERSPALDQTLLVNRKTGIEQRAFLYGKGHPFHASSTPPSIEAISDAFRNEAVPKLAVPAAQRALADAGITTHDLTHVVCTTVTDSSNPGFDVHLIDALGISDNGVERCLLAGIGCAGGLAALRAAANTVLARRGECVNVLVVAMEVVSGFKTMELAHAVSQGQLNVAVSLFSDCAAALVLTSRDLGPAAYRVLGFTSCTLPGTRDLLRYDVNPFGWKAIISPKLPQMTSTSVRPLFDDLLRACGLGHLRPEDVDWALHPGGAAILRACGETLGLNADDHLRASWSVYRKRGNSSSATVISVLQTLRGGQHAADTLAARPSDAWKTAQEHEDDGSFVTEFWKSLDLSQLEAMAKGFHPSKLSCRANRDRYAAGCNAIVLELVFEDSTIWIARITAPLSQAGSIPSDEFLSRETESAAATMRYIRERTSIPVPTVFAYSATRDNPLGRQFIMMSALRGSHPQFRLSDINNDKLAADAKLVVDRYLRCLAQSYLELSELRFDRIGALYFDPNDDSKYTIGCFPESGLGPFDTAWDFYQARAEHMENEFLALADDSPEVREGRAFILWLYRLGIAPLSSSLDNRGPFLLAHLDLVAHNTLVDETGAITGIIDWDAGAVPVEVFATQVHDWSTNFCNPFHYKRHPHKMFDSTLREVQDTADRTLCLPSGRTLQEIRSSSTTYLVGPLDLLLGGPDMCSETLYADTMCRLVLGIDDPSSLKKNCQNRVVKEEEAEVPIPAAAPATAHNPPVQQLAVVPAQSDWRSLPVNPDPISTEVSGNTVTSRYPPCRTENGGIVFHGGLTFKITTVPRGEPRGDSEPARGEAEGR
ncbi:thiolase-like protein [Exidia glandulosa HHB12029]|uniref:Thiolase-like protein n=1 Tax=Exidia glandulosa HHB12029 TaxID=1314781 RepID=A0A165PH67_EXIGL|nr:thiolase-like protein [Exidia glandulosa HHB12029]